MIEVRHLEPGDLARIEWQQGQEPERTLFNPTVADAGPAFTIWQGDRVLLTAGLIELAPHYASAWALFAPGLGGDYPAIARAIRRVLDACQYKRVDAVVRNDWGRAHALARLLGFKLEGVHPGMGDHGEAFATYGRVREEG